MAEIRIDGVIGDMFNTAEGVREQIEAMKLEKDEPLLVIINSGGGSVFDGYGIYNYLRSLPNELSTFGEGLVGSIATLILMAAPKERTSISEVSMFMIHQAISPMMGNKEVLAQQIDILESIDKTLVDVYSNRTGINKDEISALMSEELWVNGKEAVERGFVGVLANPIPAEAVASSYINLNQNKEKMLTEFFKKFKAEADAPVIEPVIKAAADMTDEEKKKLEDAKAETPKNEVVLDVSREEFDSLVESFGSFQSMMEKFLVAVEGQTEATNEAMAKVSTDVVAATEKKFSELVASLPTSKALPKADSVVGSTTDSPWSGFKAQMKTIQDKADKKNSPIL